MSAGSTLIEFLFANKLRVTIGGVYRVALFSKKGNLLPRRTFNQLPERKNFRTKNSNRRKLTSNVIERARQCAKKTREKSFFFKWKIDLRSITLGIIKKQCFSNPRGCRQLEKWHLENKKTCPLLIWLNFQYPCSTPRRAVGILKGFGTNSSDVYSWDIRRRTPTIITHVFQIFGSIHNQPEF